MQQLNIHNQQKTVIKLHFQAVIGMENTYREIISKIIKVHDLYRNRADEMSESKRNRKGNKSDHSEERQFITELTNLQGQVRTLSANMDKSPALKTKKQQINIVKKCSQDILSIVRRKQLMFKINDNLKDLVNETRELVIILEKDLKHAGETPFLCCGTDGAKKFKESLNNFNIRAQQWKIMASLEAKDSVESLMAPDYEEKNFLFIRQILQKAWPKDKQPEQRIVVKEKEVIKYINTAEPSRIAIANQYLYGINHETNVAHGLKIYHQEAKRGDPKAAAFLGQAYEEGILLPRDLQKSINFYESAIKSKDPYGSYRMALLLISGYLSEKQNKDDIKKAHQMLIKLADSQNPCPEAMVELGQLYEEGKFRNDKEGIYTINPDFKKAIAYYKKGRDHHVPRATNNLGALFINHKFFSQSNPNSQVHSEENAVQNIKKGKRFLEEAMLQGFSQSFYNLGCMYENGMLGRINSQQALLYFYNGGLKGDHYSRLKFAYQLMNQTSIMKEQYEEHYRIAHRWLQSIVHHISIAESGLESSEYNSVYRSEYPFSQPLSRPSGKQSQGEKTTVDQKAEALFYLGLMYEFGFGVDKSANKAFNFYLQSANLQNSAAKNKLGDCYFSGFGTTQNRQIAIGCYHEAAEAGNSDSMVNLGTIYLNGIPSLINIDYEKANQFFIKAVELDNSDAMVHLSYMYRAGLGFEKDDEMAKSLLEQAAKKRNSHALYLLKEMGLGFDDRILFQNLDNQFLVGPKKFNVRQLVPICSQIPSM